MNQITPSTASPPPSALASRPMVSGAQEVRQVAATSALTATARLPATDSNTPATKVASEQKNYSADEVKRATDDLQRRVKTLAPDLQFSVDDSTGRSVIKFTDRATQKVIRQFPSEEALHLTKVIDQFQRGLLLSSKV